MTANKLTKLYESQYVGGEWQGPFWYRLLTPLIQTREQVISELIPKSSARLLDIGCGEGHLIELCLPKSEEIVGIDLLASRLSIAKKKFKNSRSNKITLIQANIDNKLPFNNSYFNVVTCVSCLEYSLDPIFTLQEMYRVLSKDGICIIEVPNLAFFTERLKLVKGDLVGVAHADGWQGGRLHHFTFSSLEKLCKGLNFQVIDRVNSGLFHRVRNIWPSLLGSDIILVLKKHTL